MQRTTPVQRSAGQCRAAPIVLGPRRVSAESFSKGQRSWMQVIDQGRSLCHSQWPGKQRGRKVLRIRLFQSVANSKFTQSLCRCFTVVSVSTFSSILKASWFYFAENYRRHQGNLSTIDLTMLYNKCGFFRLISFSVKQLEIGCIVFPHQNSSSGNNRLQVTLYATRRSSLICWRWCESGWCWSWGAQRDMARCHSIPTRRRSNRHTET